MSETRKKFVKGAAVFAVFVISMALVIWGQRHVGPGGLGIMVLGLAGLIALLWFYNKQYR